MKTCSKCGNTKPVDQFSRDKTKVDGLRTQCKQCKAEADYRYQSQRREVYVENRKRWRANNTARDNAYMRNYMRGRALAS